MGIRKRANWLNKHAFTSRPIDDDALEAMCYLELGKAMEIFTEIEAKASEVENPGAYLMTAAKREAQPRGMKRSYTTSAVKTEQVARKASTTVAKRAKLDTV